MAQLHTQLTRRRQTTTKKCKLFDATAIADCDCILPFFALTHPHTYIRTQLLFAVNWLHTHTQAHIARERGERESVVSESQNANSRQQTHAKKNKNNFIVLLLLLLPLSCTCCCCASWMKTDSARHWHLQTAAEHWQRSRMQEREPKPNLSGRRTKEAEGCE